MVAENSKEEDELDEESLLVIARLGNWNMVTWTDGGIPVGHEFFLINTEDPASDCTLFKERLKQMEAGKMLGQGFTLKFLKDSVVGCHVFVKEGWQLNTSTQSKPFLEHFVQLIG